MDEIIRTKEQILALKKAMEAELRDPRIIYGKGELLDFVKELELGLAGIVNYDGFSEAAYWLISEKSTLGKDYGVE